MYTGIMKREDHTQEADFDELADQWGRGDVFVWKALAQALMGDEENLKALENWWTLAPIKELSAHQRFL